MNLEHVNIGLYGGRFSPFHKAHEYIVRNAFLHCDILIIYVGSHSTVRTQKNPWLAIERINMIKLCFTKEELKKIKFYPVIDYGEMESWLNDIMTFVLNFTKDGDTLGVFGCLKDKSSLYLNEFPSCFKKMFIEFPLYDMMSATDVRNSYFKNGIINENSLNCNITQYLKNNKQIFVYSELPEK